MHQVRDHLRDYLERSYCVVVENQAKVADQDLYLLIIQCFEVRACVHTCIRACVRYHQILIFMSSATLGCTV